MRTLITICLLAAAALFAGCHPRHASYNFSYGAPVYCDPAPPCYAVPVYHHHGYCW